jgi:hypothetical protein
MIRHFCLALLFLGVMSGSVHATCFRDDIDGMKRAAARTDIAANCDCSSLSHHDYVQCATLRLKANPTGLPQSCKADVLTCSKRSTCGRPGSVTCCTERPHGPVKCSIKKDAGHCTPPKGGESCVGMLSICCDACDATKNPPCAPIPTPTPSPRPCGLEVPFNICGGACPNGSECGSIGLKLCGCVPSGTTPCGNDAPPTCGGSCSSGDACYPILIAGSVSVCSCAPEGVACDNQCGGAVCPADSVCDIDPSERTCSCDPTP